MKIIYLFPLVMSPDLACYICTYVQSPFPFSLSPSTYISFPLASQFTPVSLSHGLLSFHFWLLTTHLPMEPPKSPSPAITTFHLAGFVQPSPFNQISTPYYNQSEKGTWPEASRIHVFQGYCLTQWVTQSLCLFLYNLTKNSAVFDMVSFYNSFFDVYW